ncbi:hypothetical protein HNQ94_003307 [Salirhabdus euzebyi]|uniref:Permuted papain-like amidase enzyme, YaeF/YiiX, C92 family n=1 Tax=Salirhabdus euzebyi TaxID=394506 RepID=A0A841Q8T5_9BACI|nr:hypothetical protein [Salirhabdus euzebyi]MBB6454818.1 hypothetical protein [Salirhabdus euzebyi]
MADIYILLTKTGSIFSQTIGLYTKAPYNHVSISLNKELTELYSFGRKKPYNPMRAGFVKECVNNGGIYARFPDTTCELYSLQVSDRQKEKMARVIDHFKKNANHYRYNFLGIATVPFGKSIERSNAYFCSQFVATVLKISGVHVWNKPPGLITPDECRNSVKLTKVFEGPLSQYVDSLCSNSEESIPMHQVVQI